MKDMHQQPIIDNRYSWEVARGLEAAAEWGEAWDSLAAKLRGVPPTADATWMRHLCRALDVADERFVLYVVLRNGHPVAFLPMIEERFGPFRVSRALFDSHLTPYTYFAVAQDHESIAEFVVANLIAYAHMVDLQRLPRECPFAVELIAAARRQGCVVARDPQGGDCWTSFSKASWEEFRTLFPANLRRNTEKATRRLERMGSLEFITAWGGPDLLPLVRECFALEAKGWKGERGWTLVGAPAAMRFYEELAETYGERGEFALYVLRHEGSLIAYEYCFRARGRIDAIKASYHPEYHRYSPSNVLRWMILHREHGVGEIDAYHLGGLDPWKLRWAEHSPPLERVLIYAPGIAGRLAWGVERLATHAQVLAATLGRRLRTMGRRLLPSAEPSRAESA